MSSIPQPVPLPMKSHPLDEAMIDKFATLFSPPTPRASPIPREENNDTIWKIPEPTFSKRPPQPPPHKRSASSDSDFGAFVSVPASEDPLASSFANARRDSDFSFANPSPSSPFSYFHADTTTSSSSSNANGHQNTSLSFFEDFTKDAKDASERNRRGILDEIERDTLFSSWMDAKWNEGEGKRDVVDVDASSQPPDPIREDPDAWSPPLPLSESLIDLDHDFFSPSDQKRTLQGQSSGSHSKSTSPPIPPSRSPTLSTATVAPPIASTSAAVSSAPSTPDIDRSASYQTLTNISSRIGGLLSSSSIPRSSSTKIRTSVDSVLAGFASINHDPHPRPHSQIDTDPIYHGTSPFGPHTVLPGSISGAPGFVPEVGWDKGYSNQLREEFESAERNTTSARELETVLHPLPRSSQSPPMGIGGWVEKKSGGVVELKGRKDTTDPVLNVQLADKIRTHLPALSRIPRTWNLLYSIDQHGISIKTLYTRAEASPQIKTQVSGFSTRVGALVVIKDSGDQVFGVYVGDGVKRGKAYYGNGESFLWKNKNQNQELEVFPWTGKNEYFALCDSEFLSFGGGDGAYGLYIDESLLEGSSARCPTFDNSPLCSNVGMKKGKAVMFECVGLELWGVGP